MKKFLKKFSMFIPLIVTSAVAIVVIAFALQNREGVLEVTVKVTQSFSLGNILLADPEVTASVTKEVGSWKTGDNVTIRFKWPCNTEKFSCEWDSGTHPAMHEANHDAANLQNGLCYIMILDRVGATKANFNSEEHDPRKVPC